MDDIITTNLLFYNLYNRGFITLLLFIFLYVFIEFHLIYTYNNITPIFLIIYIFMIYAWGIYKINYCHILYKYAFSKWILKYHILSSDEQNRTINRNRNGTKPHQLKIEPNKNRTNDVVLVWFKFCKTEYKPNRTTMIIIIDIILYKLI